MTSRTVANLVSFGAFGTVRGLAFAALAILAATSRVIAASVEVGGVSINLPPPPGFCELSQSNAPDKGMVTKISDLVSKMGNKLLSMAADCHELAVWRVSKGKLLDNVAEYQTLITQTQASSASPVPINQMCAYMRAEGEKILSDHSPDWNARIESGSKLIKINENIFIGVLVEEPTACYAGMIQKAHTDADTDKTTLILFAVTIIKNKTIFVYRYAVHTSPDTVSDGLAKLKENVAMLYAANE